MKPSETNAQPIIVTTDRDPDITLEQLHPLAAMNGVFLIGRVTRGESREGEFFIPSWRWWDSPFRTTKFAWTPARGGTARGSFLAAAPIAVAFPSRGLLPRERLDLDFPSFRVECPLLSNEINQRYPAFLSEEGILESGFAKSSLV